MIRPLSVRALYTLAYAEGEGVGTAYEYFVKRRLLRRLLGDHRPASIVVAGLPAVYGTSLDFVQLGAEYDAPVTVVDPRPAALARLRGAVEQAQVAGMLRGVRLEAIQADPTGWLADAPHFDLALTSERLQQLSSEAREAAVRGLSAGAARLALFVPNADNDAHVGRSGLGGMTLDSLRRLLATAAPDGNVVTSGYVDLPPFPPGITRTDEQRQQAASGRLEAAAMWGLQGYAHLERFLPIGFRRQQAHIVYALAHNTHRERAG